MDEVNRPVANDDEKNAWEDQGPAEKEPAVEDVDAFDNYLDKWAHSIEKPADESIQEHLRESNEWLPSERASYQDQLEQEDLNPTTAIEDKSEKPLVSSRIE